MGIHHFGVVVGGGKIVGVMAYQYGSLNLCNWFRKLREITWNGYLKGAGEGVVLTFWIYT